ncbi:MAG: PQQ-binding-like beta-propeller repeat protein [Chloroflexi bacterium]|nr:PQQ-binding-like beta-propeller repeat protein [Chloroflexota bacterium]
MQPRKIKKQAPRLLRVLAPLVLLLLLIVLPVAADSPLGWTHTAEDTVMSISSSADGSRVVIGARDNTVTVYDENGQQLWQFTAENSVSGVAMSADGAYVACASADRNVRLFDGDGNLLWTYRSAYPLEGVAISEDGQYVSAASVEGRRLFLFNLAGELLWDKNMIVPTESTAIYGSGENTRVLAGTRDSRVYLFNLKGDQLYAVQLDDVVHSVAVNRNGSLIAAATDDGKISLIDGATAKVLWQYNARRSGATDRMRAAGISADGNVVMAGVSYGDVFIFDVNGNLTQQIKNAGDDIQAVYVSRDGKVVMYGGKGMVATVSNLSAQAAAYTRKQNLNRGLIIGVVVLVVVLLAGGYSAVRFTSWGAKVWNVALVPVRKLLKEIWAARVSYLFLLPTFALLLIFNYYPAISGLWHGFTRWTPGLRATWVGLDNYIAAFKNPYLRVGIGNALIIIITGFAKLIMPLIVAELIFNLRSSKLQYILRTAYVIPLIVPGVVSILMWVNIYDPNYGLLNKALEALGMENLIRVWLGDPQTALPSIIFMGFPWIGAFPLLLLYGGLITIPTDLFDAAKVDGATFWQRFIHIDLPLLMSPIRTLIILGFIGGVQSFESIFLTTMGGPGHATYVPALELYFQATKFNRMGMASAIGTLLFIFILGGTILNMKYVRSSTEYQA